MEPYDSLDSQSVQEPVQGLQPMIPLKPLPDDSLQSSMEPLPYDSFGAWGRRIGTHKAYQLSQQEKSGFEIENKVLAEKSQESCISGLIRTYAASPKGHIRFLTLQGP